MLDRYKDYQHPKADVKGFWDEDYVKIFEEDDGDYHVTHYKNSAGRIRIDGQPLTDDKIPFHVFPGGGCNFVNGTIFCSFAHIDWKLPNERTNANANGNQKP